mmetsp:Transcript_156336/g.501558  ORF Transcript_156336/g.501558 Transcript_156336/m.501558 type:complete len:255 (+) Transcript_156336:199-963(+)
MTTSHTPEISGAESPAQDVLHREILSAERSPFLRPSSVGCPRLRSGGGRGGCSGRRGGGRRPAIGPRVRAAPPIQQPLELIDDPVLPRPTSEPLGATAGPRSAVLSAHVLPFPILCNFLSVRFVRTCHAVKFRKYTAAFGACPLANVSEGIFELQPLCQQFIGPPAPQNSRSAPHILHVQRRELLPSLAGVFQLEETRRTQLKTANPVALSHTNDVAKALDGLSILLRSQPQCLCQPHRQALLPIRQGPLLHRR